MPQNISIQTELGDIVVELDTERAPITSANFLRYVDDERYENIIFYRVVRLDNQPDNDVKIEVIQGGLGMGEHPKKLPPIKQETTNITGILHKDGVISMARLAPDSAHSEFFICINDQPELDFGGKRNADGNGFAAFGRVTRGMDIVRKIQALPAEKQAVIKPVVIKNITRV